MRQRKPGRKLVFNTEKFYYPFLLSINVQTLRIGGIDLDYYSLDDKVKYISLN